MTKKMYTDYRTAVKWCNNALIMQNDICQLDENFINENIELFAGDGEGNYPEFFQFFLTDMSEGDKEYLEKTFDLIIGYSSKFGHYVLCVPHWGTAWDYVPCEVKSKEWWEINGEKYGYKH